MNNPNSAFNQARRNHDHEACNCAYCVGFRAMWRERMAAMRRRFWMARDMIEDEAESEQTTIELSQDSSEELDQQ